MIWSTKFSYLSMVFWATIIGSLILFSFWDLRFKFLRFGVIFSKMAWFCNDVTSIIECIKNVIFVSTFFWEFWEWIFSVIDCSVKIQKGSVETKSPWMFLGDHHFRNLFFKNLNFCKMSLDEFHGQIFSLQHLRQRISEFIYLSKLKIFENLLKNEDFWKFGQIWRFFKFGKNWRFFKIWEKLKIFENLVKIQDFSNFGKNWRFLKI